MEFSCLRPWFWPKIELKNNIEKFNFAYILKYLNFCAKIGRYSWIFHPKMYQIIEFSCQDARFWSKNEVNFDQFSGKIFEFFFFWKIWLNFFLNLPVSFFFARYNFFPFSFASFKTHFLLVFQENRQIIRRKSLWRKIMSLRPHRTSQSCQCEVGRCWFRRQHGSYRICLSHEIR